MQEPSAISDLLEACRSRPRSSALLRVLLQEAGRTAIVEPVASYLHTLTPQTFDDPKTLEMIASFFRQAGLDEQALKWCPIIEHPVSQIVDFSTGRAVPPMSHKVLTFEDVGGLQEVKRHIARRVLAPLRKPGLFHRFQRRSGGGVLLYGPPGCGKTMLARATAGEAGATFLPVEVSDILDGRLGFSEKRLKAVFDEARKRSPSVLFFDELEALAARRHHEARDHKSSLVSAFLTTFDSTQEQSSGVLVLAATNVPWSIDSAFRRPGRFDRTIFVAPPDYEARLTILAALLRERPLQPGLDPQWLARSSSGYSGADLLHLVETAIDLMFEDDDTEQDAAKLERRHFEGALKEVKPTTLEWLTTARNYGKYANDSGLYDDVLEFLDKHQRR